MIEIGRHGSRVPVGWPRHHRQTSQVSAPHTSDPGTYGRSFADVYDAWYADAFDTAAAVTTLSQMAGDGPVLELGVGTGRLAIPLAHNGLRIFGLDASHEMLERLHIADPDQTVVSICGDMSKVDDALRGSHIEEQFTLVFCAFNTLLNLSDVDSMTQCLRESRTRLRPNGKVVIEAFVPINESMIPTHSLSPARVQSDAPVFIETAFEESNSRLSGRHIEVRDGVVTVRPWSVLICGPERLDAIAKQAGLTLVERWSDWNGNRFTDESTAHVSIYAPTE